MSKHKSKHTQQPRDVTPYWESRGYRPDIASLTPASQEDPQGEEAYQRAFAAAAKQTPPRLPNPSHYPNSPSAREYLQRRNEDFYATRSEKRQVPESPDAKGFQRRMRDPDRSPLVQNRSLSREASNTPPSHHSQQLMKPASYPSPPGQYPSSMASCRPDPAAYALDTSPAGYARLSAIEPTIAPMGPSSRLR